jgi:tRNA A-37 threonylcarbamoyl transferase component Bud32
MEQDPQTVELCNQLRSATLGEYDVYAPIGRGGMATVFLALDLALEREVAIKVISPDMLQTKTLVERFKREARTVAALSHPNIIPVYQVKEADGLVFFVMKYVAGRSLESIIREQGAIGFDLTVSVLRQAGSALQFAHRKGVIHRDVKPANVMVDEDGWVIVTDFGIAKVSDSTGLTSAGMVVGTPAYMSPEQFSGGQVTGAADQYSLGAVAYEMLTGRTPFTATSVGEMMRAHLIDFAVPPRTLRPEVSSGLSEVIMRMLQKSTDARWPSIDDALAALEPLSRVREEGARAVLISLARSGAQLRPRISVPLSPVPTRGVEAPATVVRRMSTRPKGRRRAAALGVAAALALGAAFLVYTQTRRTGDNSTATQSLDTVPAQKPAVLAPRATDSIAPGVERDLAKTPGKSGPVRPPAAEARKSAPPAVQPGPAATPPRTAAAKPDTGANRDTAAKRPGSAVGNPAATLLGPPTASASVVESLRVSPPAATPVSGDAVVRVGSRIPNAVLYIDGKAQDFITGLRYLTLPPGLNRIGIHAEGCKPWDTTVTVRAGDTLRINYRSPTCPP